MKTVAGKAAGNYIFINSQDNRGTFTFYSVHGKESKRIHKNNILIPYLHSHKKLNEEGDKQLSAGTTLQLRTG